MQQPINRLLLLTSALASCFCLHVSASLQFIDFGVNSNDSRFVSGSAISSVEVSLESPILFYRKAFTSVFVSLTESVN